MNLVLLEPGELSGDGVARVGGRRAAHVVEVLRAAPGSSLQVGVVGGRLGTGEVLATDGGEVVLRAVLDRDPPARSRAELLLALPRPKTLRRVLQAIASMGIARVVLLGSYRVEKSYFGSPLLAPGGLGQALRLGLEQGRDTVLPEVITRRLFKPFVEDELDSFFPDYIRLLAHPAAHASLDELRPRDGRPEAVAPSPVDALPTRDARALVAIGPEGGWTPYEAEQLEARGFLPFTLGPRALRVDTAVPYVVGQLELWLRRLAKLIPPPKGRFTQTK